MTQLFSVEDLVIVITGVEGQLGAEYASSLLESGAKVFGMDLRSAERTAELKRQHGDRFSFHPTDIRSATSIDSAYEKCSRTFGVPDVLVNNAAIDSPPDAPQEETGPFETYPDASWDNVMDVNVKGVYLTCKKFGGAMSENGRGSVINVSSIYGVVSPDPKIYDYRKERGEVFYKPVAYSVSKSALMNLTRYLAVYWAKSGVRVNTLVIAGVENAQEDAFKATYCGRIPVGRMADSHEYNGAVTFLASEASKYMTGSTLTMDGGWTAI